MSQINLILIVLASYLLIWLLLSYISSRRADNSTYFSGNRKMPWPLIAIAMIGAPISGVTFISVPGMVMTKGFSYLQMGLGFIVGYLIIALILVPIYYKHNIVSIYGYLENRFGQTSSKMGSILFFVSKILGISVRLFIVCAMLQLLIFDTVGIPFIFTVILSLTLIWGMTFKGGVKSVIFGDVLKSVCLFSTIILCIYFISVNLGIFPDNFYQEILDRDSTKIFHFDDPSDTKYFWKQFIAGIFIVIAMTGLDQDMMQRTLSCKNITDARKNLIVSSILQFVICSLLLILGVFLITYMETKGISLPEKSDNLFASVAFHNDIPLIIGALFILGLVSSTFASVASALTAMTTTVSFDMLDDKKSPSSLSKKRKVIHSVISLLMVVIVLSLFYLNNDDAISTIYTLISYTDGPILGLFLFAIFTKRSINERFLPLICLIAPVLSWISQWTLNNFYDYHVSFELLILNCLLTVVGLYLVSSPSVEAIDSPEIY